MDIDAVIIEVEFQLESQYNEFGHFVCLRFVDQSPNHYKLKNLVRDMSQYPDVKLIDYNYNIEPITENTDITDFEIVKH